ncbi:MULTISPECIES: hypothetical protein [Acinetobacter]|uniref:hypothetical protein n=1 Tax=Acinetobacter TaxID=469 RepID=UPI00070C4AFC|nr:MULTISPECIES: hypothetical protein [Acinetobacter calcoaceticus/baumannii complex]KRJ65161.1 hypothetical protein APC92_01730 [Acinetobacter pittii]OAM12539.1 hypothetical protein AZK46_06810 [Acinetobacter baumannii]OCA07300.1 hypothetical protein XM61_18095 [Acinetobacter pittii]
MHIIPQPKNHTRFHIESGELNEIHDFTEHGKELLYDSFCEEDSKKFFNEKKLKSYLKVLSSTTKIGKKKSFNFPQLKATCNISYDSSSYLEQTFVEYLLSKVIWSLNSWIYTYTKEKNCEILLGLKWENEVWRNVKGEEFNPLCIDDLDKMLCHANPSTLIFLQSPSSYSDPICGFGLYLFDENFKLIFKTIFKFIDLEDAPSNAFRLNTPNSLEDFEDLTRSFLSCNFTTS